MEPNISIFPQVQLFLCCRKLKDVEVMSKTDPIVEVLQKRTSQGQWVVRGHTEIIWDNLNPDFITNFIFDFHFEQQLYLKFKLYNGNDKNGTLRGANFIGEAECTLGEIIGSPGQQLIRTLFAPDRKSCGNIVLRTQEKAQSKQILTLQLGGANLKDISSFMRSFKPFFYISRSMENGSNQRVYMSEASKGKNISWKQFQIPMQVVCNNDYDRPISIDVYDHHSSGNHDYLGSVQTSIRKLTEQSRKVLEIVDQRKHKKSLGKLLIKNLNITQQHSFIDYIAGGCQIELVVAVDFTASNGDPRQRDSLHFLNQNGFNDYQSALRSVGQILLNYDSSKRVPMFGFGGKLQGQLSHCFHVNFDPRDPHVEGLNGILMAYRNALMQTQLSGPTLFSQILSTVVGMAEQHQISQQRQVYYVLLILTDGEIHDMRDTIDWIVRGSASPISIVIVGLGRDNFTNMRILDADDQPLIDSRGRRMERDIVQFVPYRKVGNSATMLAKEVLDEIPREILNFFGKKGIVPNPPVQAPTISRLDTKQIYGQPSWEENKGGIPPPDMGYPRQDSGYPKQQFGVPRQGSSEQTGQYPRNTVGMPPTGIYPPGNQPTYPPPGNQPPYPHPGYPQSPGIYPSQSGYPSGQYPPQPGNYPPQGGMYPPPPGPPGMYPPSFSPQGGPSAPQGYPGQQGPQGYPGQQNPQGYPGQQGPPQYPYNPGQPVSSNAMMLGQQAIYEAMRKHRNENQQQ